MKRLRSAAIVAPGGPDMDQDTDTQGTAGIRSVFGGFAGVRNSMAQ